jgi:ABC-2 type transport system permease protein
MNYIGFYSLLKREIERFFIIIHQTLTPAIVSAVLYIIIFGYSIGRQLRPIDGFSYLQFIVPGLVMMEVIMSAYMNTSFSLFISRRYGNIKDILTAPLSYFEMVLAITLGGVIRGLIVGLAIFIVATLLTDISVYSFPIVIYYAVLVNIIFSCLGVIIGLAAKEFEDINILVTFFLTPFTFLGGVFYSIRNLPPTLQQFSHYNPILYMIDGFRYGTLGIHDANLIFCSIFVLLTAISLFLISIHLFKKGYNLRT